MHVFLPPTWVLHISEKDLDEVLQTTTIFTNVSKVWET